MRFLEAEKQGLQYSFDSKLKITKFIKTITFYGNFHTRLL